MTEVVSDLHCNVAGGRLFSKKGVHGGEAAFHFQFYPCTALNATARYQRVRTGGRGSRNWGTDEGGRRRRRSYWERVACE